MDEAMAEILRIRARLAELEALVAKPIDRTTSRSSRVPDGAGSAPSQAAGVTANPLSA